MADSEGYNGEKENKEFKKRKKEKKKSLKVLNCQSEIGKTLLLEADWHAKQ